MDVSSQTLEEILDQEFEFLKSGHFSDLAPLLSVKEQSWDMFCKQRDHSPSEMQNIVEKFNRNQEALKAASQGMRDVSRRLAVIRRLQTGFESYSAEGQRLQAHSATRGRRL